MLTPDLDDNRRSWRPVCSRLPIRPDAGLPTAALRTHRLPRGRRRRAVRRRGAQPRQLAVAVRQVGRFRIVAKSMKQTPVRVSWPSVTQQPCHRTQSAPVFAPVEVSEPTTYSIPIAAGLLLANAGMLLANAGLLLPQLLPCSWRSRLQCQQQQHLGCVAAAHAAAVTCQPSAAVVTPFAAGSATAGCHYWPAGIWGCSAAAAMASSEGRALYIDGN